MKQLYTIESAAKWLAQWAYPDLDASNEDQQAWFDEHWRDFLPDAPAAAYWLNVCQTERPTPQENAIMEAVLQRIQKVSPPGKPWVTGSLDKMPYPHWRLTMTMLGV